MTSNTIKNYNESIELIETLLSNASYTEKVMLESAIGSIKEAKLQMISEKKQAADSLYESGKIDEKTYDAYLEYVEDNEFNTQSDLLPYMETASIGAALTLGESEKNAYASTRCDHIICMENGDELSSSDTKFLKSRLSKYLMLCEESEFSEIWEHDIDEGYMTESLHDFINTSKKLWNKESVKYERVAQEYVTDIINKKGNSEIITEQVNEALADGYISPRIAIKMKSMIELADIKSTL